MCDLETSRMDAPYIYDISRLRVKQVVDVELLKENSSPRHFPSIRSASDVGIFG